MKTLGAILIAAVLLAIRIIIPKAFIEENAVFTEAASACSHEEDPRIVASVHFDHPLQRLLTLKTIVTGQENGAVYVSGYTLFGIELTKARIACEGGGGGWRHHHQGIRSLVSRLLQFR